MDQEIKKDCDCGRAVTSKCNDWCNLTEEGWKTELAKSVRGIENRIKVKIAEQRVKGKAPFKNKRK